MRRFVTLLAVFSALAFAESWNGKLADAKCAAEQKAAACNPTDATVAFVLAAADGKAYKLDDAGNKKAADAMKNRADRSKEPSAPAAPNGASPSPNTPSAAGAPITASVTGKLEGDVIQVEAITIE